MSSFLEYLIKHDALHSKSVSSEEILAAEKTLNVEFAKEYADYVKEFGIASLGSHEFTGLTSSKRLNVVQVTQEQRTFNSNIPSDLYVVEELNLDEIIIWQNSVGEIYKTCGNQVPQLIAKSLIEYLKMG